MPILLRHLGADEGGGRRDRHDRRDGGAHDEQAHELRAEVEDPGRTRRWNAHGIAAPRRKAAGTSVPRTAAHPRRTSGPAAKRMARTPAAFRSSGRSWAGGSSGSTSPRRKKPAGPTIPAATWPSGSAAAVASAPAARSATAATAARRGGLTTTKRRRGARAPGGPVAAPVQAGDRGRDGRRGDEPPEPVVEHHERQALAPERELGERVADEAGAREAGAERERAALVTLARDRVGRRRSRGRLRARTRGRQRRGRARDRRSTSTVEKEVNTRVGVPSTSRPPTRARAATRAAGAAGTRARARRRPLGPRRRKASSGLVPPRPAAPSLVFHTHKREPPGAGRPSRQPRRFGPPVALCPWNTSSGGRGAQPVSLMRRSRCS
jgi:hypothetical protein